MEKKLYGEDYINNNYIKKRLYKERILWQKNHIK